MQNFIISGNGKETFYIYGKILIGHKHETKTYEYMMTNKEINEYLIKNDKKYISINFKKFIEVLKEIEGLVLIHLKTNRTKSKKL